MYKKKSGTIPTNLGAEKIALYSLISIFLRYSTSIFLPGSVQRRIFSPMRFRRRGSESRFGVRGVRRSALPSLPNATTCTFDDMQKLKKYGASRGSAALSISRVARTPCHRLQADNACALNSTVREPSPEYRKAGHNRHRGCRRRDTVASRPGFPLTRCPPDWIAEAHCAGTTLILHFCSLHLCS